VRASLQSMAALYVGVKALILERQRLGWSRNIGDTAKAKNIL
jgi:hypothetical protein